ncbi:MAG: hypothetical protein KDE32_16280 [Novosphingobium sp.]|nr:hypothetical protein [Novosphingobium sp.]
MARFDFIVLSRCTPGEEATFEKWYADQHLPDVCAIDGVEAARFTRIRFQKTVDLDAPEWGYLAIYTLDADDPQTVIDAIAELRGTDAMPLSDALNRDGMVQAIGETIATYP